MAGGPEDWFFDSSWNIRCQECYKKIKAQDAKRRWDHLLVCPECWEIRNPQDFVKGIPDNPSVPFSTGNLQPIYIGEQQETRVMDAYACDGQTMG